MNTLVAGGVSPTRYGHFFVAFDGTRADDLYFSLAYSDFPFEREYSLVQLVTYTPSTPVL